MHRRGAVQSGDNEGGWQWGSELGREVGNGIQNLRLVIGFRMWEVRAGGSDLGRLAWGSELRLEMGFGTWEGGWRWSSGLQREVAMGFRTLNSFFGISNRNVHFQHSDQWPEASGWITKVQLKITSCTWWPYLLTLKIDTGEMILNKMTSNKSALHFHSLQQVLSAGKGVLRLALFVFEQGRCCPVLLLLSLQGGGTSKTHTTQLKTGQLSQRPIESFSSQHPCFRLTSMVPKCPRAASFSFCTWNCLAHSQVTIFSFVFR